MEKSLKRLSIFFVLIFFISILGVIYHYHEDGMPHDDCFICKIITTNNRIFLTKDTYQVFSNGSAVSSVFIYKDFITPYILTNTFSIRAPPA